MKFILLFYFFLVQESILHNTAFSSTFQGSKNSTLLRRKLSNGKNYFNIFYFPFLAGELTLTSYPASGIPSPSNSRFCISPSPNVGYPRQLGPSLRNIRKKVCRTNSALEYLHLEISNPNLISTFSSSTALQTPPTSHTMRTHSRSPIPRLGTYQQLKHFQKPIKSFIRTNSESYSVDFHRSLSPMNLSSFPLSPKDRKVN
jgi:hypothetical protein